MTTPGASASSSLSTAAAVAPPFFPAEGDTFFGEGVVLGVDLGVALGGGEVGEGERSSVEKRKLLAPLGDLPLGDRPVDPRRLPLPRPLPRAGWVFIFSNGGGDKDCSRSGDFSGEDERGDFSGEGLRTRSSSSKIGGPGDFSGVGDNPTGRR